MGRQEGLFLIHADEDVRHRALERYHAVIDLAADWRVPAAIGRCRGLLSAAPSRETGLRWWRAALHDLIEHAERRDVTLLLEPQNRYNADLLVTMDETLRLLQEVGSSRLRIEATRITRRWKSAPSSLRMCALVATSLTPSSRIATVWPRDADQSIGWTFWRRFTRWGTTAG